MTVGLQPWRRSMGPGSPGMDLLVHRYMPGTTPLCLTCLPWLPSWGGSWTWYWYTCMNTPHLHVPYNSLSNHTWHSTMQAGEVLCSLISSGCVVANLPLHATAFCSFTLVWPSLLYCSSQEEPQERGVLGAMPPQQLCKTGVVIKFSCLVTSWFMFCLQY